MHRDKEELHRLADWPGVEGGSRQKALEHLQCECLPLIVACCQWCMFLTVHLMFVQF